MLASINGAAPMLPYGGVGPDVTAGRNRGGNSEILAAGPPHCLLTRFGSQAQLCGDVTPQPTCVWNY
jgi:hypothetical protein